MLIREALPEELDAVGELTVAAYVCGGHVPAGSDYVEQLRDARSRAAAATLLVAVSSDLAVCGTVTFCLAGTPYADLAEPGEAEFRMLAVAPDAGGQGIGTQLVARCVALAQAARSSALVMSSMPTMTAAHRIYERLGFRREPSRDWDPVPGLRLQAFVRPLSGGRTPPARSGYEAQAAKLDGQVMRRG